MRNSAAADDLALNLRDNCKEALACASLTKDEPRRGELPVITYATSEYIRILADQIADADGESKNFLAEQLERSEAARQNLEHELVSLVQSKDSPRLDQSDHKSDHKSDQPKKPKKKRKRPLSRHSNEVARILKREKKRGGKLSKLSKAEAIEQYLHQHPDVKAKASTIDRELSDHSELWK